MQHTHTLQSHQVFWYKIRWIFIDYTYDSYYTAGHFLAFFSLIVIFPPGFHSLVDQHIFDYGQSFHLPYYICWMDKHLYIILVNNNYMKQYMCTYIIIYVCIYLCILIHIYVCIYIFIHICSYFLQTNYGASGWGEISS